MERKIASETDTANPEKSYHIFTFPFKWDFKPKGSSLERTEFFQRTSLENFHQIISTTDSPWQEKPFKISEPLDYNEYIYFYDFAREALFPNQKNTKTLRQYEYNLDPAAKPVYKIKTIKPTASYELIIKKILLTTYFTGVGILSFHLVNDEYHELQDILRINEYGRKIYPQFLKKNQDGLTESAKKSFLADTLEVRIDDSLTYFEDFSHFDKIERVKENPNMLSNTIMGILGDSFFKGTQEKESSGIYISSVLDDRMFVLCWVADKSLCGKLAKYDKEKETYGYLENDDWFKLVFVDKDSPSCTSIPMKKKLLAEQTYDRWIGTEWSSLFGITRYSFVMLNDDSETFVKDHLKTMYFQMVKLVLVQRASILRFSSEVARVADMKEGGNITSMVSDIQKKYLQFINKIYFREITAFDQGIELYGKIIQAMNIERDVKELNQEIEELHQHASLQEEKRNSKQLQLLTILGSLFLIPSFILSFFGLNIFSKELVVESPGKFWVIVVGIGLTSLIAGVLATKSDKMKKSSFCLLVLLGILLIVMLISGCLFSILGV